MALILAVNPGNRHSPTLARLARELPGCELIGAESCAVAIKAIKKRVPDVLLLPAAQARGEADLIAHLRTVPGGVLTLKLPTVESADPVDLARQIREMLTGVPMVTSSRPVVVPPRPVAAPVKPVVARPAPVIAAPVPATVSIPTQDQVEAGTSPEVIEAAATAISWIRARRARWSEPIEPVELQQAPEAQEPSEPVKPRRDYESPEPDEPKLYEPIGPYEALELPEQLDEPAAPVSAGGRFSAFMPRAVVAAAVVALAAAAVIFWPRIFGSGNTPESPSALPQSAETGPPVVPQTNVPAEPPPAVPAAPASGWVAVTVPFEVSITEEGQPVTLDEQGRVVLAPGKHRLRLQNAERGYDATRTVQVTQAETTTLTLNPEATISVTANEPAEVLIDGTRVGDTPYEGKVGLGAHTVTVKTPGAERQIAVEATSKPVQLEVDFSKP